MSISFSIRLPFTRVQPKPPAKLSNFPVQKPDIPQISARDMASHPQARAFLERAKKLYAAGHLRRTSDVLMSAAYIFVNNHPRAPYPALCLVETAAEIQLFLGKKKTARNYLNACAELAEAWGFPYSAKEFSRRADRIR